ncbi:amidohydrolase family protein [Arthrobacter sp. FW305-BF8]|uniref:amidohydrolase family protein n=1 Tax=Arthrobacter sp. FW305-BF8 TaxID=2879617 RepID=UPI001F4733C1|nr:amidohydrolase family protein [Arthrobacter sp. FW305-BF8]UKA55218.1 amidohydrolase family protein [Arthrobacter sp. FW305-BF8]
MGTATEIEILDPELEIIDPHHHLWPPTGAVVSMAAGPGQQTEKGAQLPDCPPYSYADLRRDATSGHRVVGSVYVECSSFYRDDGPDHLRPVGESETIAAMELRDGLCQGIVGFADLMMGTSVKEVLEAHLEEAGPRFKGIRHSVAWDPDPGVYATYRRPPGGLLLDSRFRAGAAELTRRGLSFDTWLNFHQLPELTDFASANPDLTIVLDHLGGPATTGRHVGHRDEVRREWREHMIAASQRPNVFLKLGAIGMRAFSGPELFAGNPVTAERIEDYWGSDVRFCIDTFGPERCMFESNFPVDRALCDYVTLWNAFKLIASSYSLSEKEWLFARAARAAYRL